MRSLMLALAATSLTVPAAMVATPAAAHQTRYYSGKTWYDGQGRMRCKRPNGTTGLIVGAAGGALLGRVVDTHGERTTGTVLGAAAGALLGRHIERKRTGYRCR